MTAHKHPVAPAADRSGSPALRSAVTYSYEHVSLEECSWIADEDFVSDWGPYGLRETDQGLRATTLPKLGATRNRSLILNKPLCAGCNEPISGGAKDGDGGVCHDCEVVFHRDEPDGWERAERSAYLMGGQS